MRAKMPRSAKKSKNLTTTADRVCIIPLLSSFFNPLRKIMEEMTEMMKVPVIKTTKSPKLILAVRTVVQIYPRPIRTK